MGIRFGLRSQIVLVVALFVASLTVLLSSSLVAVWLPGRQEEISHKLSDASRRMAEEAAPLLEDEAIKTGKEPSPEWYRRLAEITRQALADLPAEGGFFLNSDWNEFTGFAFPNDPHPPPETGPSPQRPPGKKHKHGTAPPLPAPPRREPPPRETDFVVTQIHTSLVAEPDELPIVQTRQIGPSHVMVVSDPSAASVRLSWRRGF